MVFYRKYRPQNIAELDNSEVREKLYSVLSSSSVPHAFLFTGPKGLGKTSTARIVTKAVNCERVNVISSSLSGLRAEGLSKAKDLKKKRDSSSTPQNDNRNNVEPCNKCYQCTS